MSEAALVVDAANVIGSRPDGWWRDRAGAAARFVEEVRSAVRAGTLDAEVVVVLEGRARAAVDAGRVDGVEVVPAPGEGDDAVVAVVRATSPPTTVVTADRALAARVVELGAEVVGPRWLLAHLGSVED